MLFPFLAYAEIHYRFRYFFSLLKKREPEIIVDVPHRLSLPSSLPLLVLVKDAHDYPVTLQKIEVFINTRKVFEQTLNLSVRERFFERIFEIPLENQSEGRKDIHVKIVYRMRDKIRTCWNDNYRQTSHAPLQCYFSAHGLPREPGWLYGDMHSHSSYTEDQIEFGAGLPTMKRMAQAVGLDFFAVTDHSYDLDDEPGNYLRNDPALPKWQAFKNESQQLNAEGTPPILIPGEEASVGNSRGQNVHLLILNNPTFVRGSGDSGEKWFRFKPEHALSELPALISEQAMLVPAHPAEPVPWVQKLFINRGEWHPNDLQGKFGEYLQWINGGKAKEITRGLRLWVQMLLSGQKAIPLAGNDAHGHFARTRQIVIPFFLLQEKPTHVFGKWKTGLYCPQTPRTPQEILQAIRSGRVFVTNGPFLELTAQAAGQTFFMGQQAPFVDAFTIRARSSAEFGPLLALTVFYGDLTLKREQIIWEENFDQRQEFSFHKKIALPISGKNGYIRCQVKTSVNGREFTAFSNVIRIRKDS